MMDFQKVCLREKPDRVLVVGSDPEKILDAAGRALRGEFPKGRVPDRWDGRAGERIVAHLLQRSRKNKV